MLSAHHVHGKNQFLYIYISARNIRMLGHNRNVTGCKENSLFFHSVLCCHCCGYSFVVFHLVTATRTQKVLRQVGMGYYCEGLYLVLRHLPLISLGKFV